MPTDTYTDPYDRSELDKITHTLHLDVTLNDIRQLPNAELGQFARALDHWHRIARVEIGQRARRLTGGTPEPLDE